MKNLIHAIFPLINNKLIKNNAIILLGSLVGGFGNYLYNFAMIRSLTPHEYAEVAALLSLFSIISIPASVIQISISRFSAEIAATNDFKKLSYFIKQTARYFLKLGFISFIAFLLVTPFIGSFLNLSSIYPLIILSFAIILLFVTTVGTGALQGMQKFTAYSVSGIISVLLKLLLAIFLVSLGFKTIGAIAAIVLGSLLSLIYIYYSLKLLKTEKSFFIDRSKIIKYSKVVLLATFCITILSNIDIILVKHFWEASLAAKYSVLSLTGKIIFFLTSAAALVMFPIVIDRHSRNEKHFHILKYSSFLVMAIGFGITGVYFLIPNIIIRLLFGTAYLEIAPYLGYFGLIMTFFSLINLLTTYYLSLNKNDFVPALFLGTIAEIALIGLFHQNIEQIILDMAIIITAILIALTIPQIKLSLFGIKT